MCVIQFLPQTATGHGPPAWHATVNPSNARTMMMSRGRRGRATAALCACASALCSPKRALGFVPVAGFAPHPVTLCRHHQPHHLLTWQSPSALASGENRDQDASNVPTKTEPQSPEMDEEKAYPKAAIYFGAFVALTVCATLPSLMPHTIYMTMSNVFYLFRRANLRRTTPFDILRVRTTLEHGVSLQLFALYIIAWQLLVMVFPLSESAARLCGHASFFYSYPNARGGGYILEPLAVQHLPGNRRAREQFRLDWHRFSYNVGKVGRDGYRHPPAVQRNLPHFDYPRKQLKHWPWRRKISC